MKIATFNINNVNRRLPNLLQWLKAAKPDVVCLQELKCTDTTFPTNAINRAGYSAVWRGQRTWNGVAILSCGAEPVITRMALPGDPSDVEARYIEAAVSGILVGCLPRLISTEHTTRGAVDTAEVNHATNTHLVLEFNNQGFARQLRGHRQ
jgi:exodeoxyribonuclease-3